MEYDRTAEHSCICTLGRACVGRFVDLLAALLQATPMSKQHWALVPPIFAPLILAVLFFNPFYCAPCVLPDTLVLRCTKFISCVKAALLAKRAVVACFAAWVSE